jgi:SulP family sulfate permease
VTTNPFRADLLAGATVALVAVPQCIAYAVMAGLPPAYGLATAIVPAVVAAVAGGSPFVITGPTNTTSLLILGVVVPFAGAGGLAPEAFHWVATLTLLCGVLRFVVAFGGGVVLIRFIPESVLTGFMVGAGVLIGLMQVDEALGLPPVRAGDAASELQGLMTLLAGGSSPSPLAIAVAAASTAAVALAQRRSPQIPAALAVILGSASLAWGLGLDAASGLPLVGDRTQVPSGWPAVAMPLLDTAVLAPLLVPAAAIVLLGTLELMVTLRAENPRADVHQEIVAQGLANIAGAFSSAFPASASLTRSVLLRMGQPRSRAAAVMAATLVVPVLLFGAGIIRHIPQAALAGILFVIAAAMVRRPTLGRLWRASAVSRLLFGVTLVCTLVLPVTWAVLAGVALGLIIHLARTSVPRVRPLTFHDDRLVPVEPGQHPSVVVLEISGAVHYAAIDPLLEDVERHLPSAARLVILDLSHAHELRFTGLRALEWWAADLERRGIRLRLAGVTPDVREMLEGAGSRLPYTMSEPEPGRSAWNSFRSSQL